MAVEVPGCRDAIGCLEHAIREGTLKSLQFGAAFHAEGSHHVYRVEQPLPRLHLKLIQIRRSIQFDQGMFSTSISHTSLPLPCSIALAV